MQQDFIESNQIKKLNNEEKKREENQQKLKETYKYFPYTGSDEVERRRLELKLNQRKEFQELLSQQEKHS
jgi:hypothetical protein